MTSPATRTIGEYHIIKRLGLGGMGEVFLAEKTMTMGFRKRVAIKVPTALNSDDLARFEAEAILAATLQHQNIVQVYDLKTDHERPALVMEYIDGVTLAQLLAHAHGHRTPLPTSVIVHIASGVSAALAYAHQLTDENNRPRHVIHRDVCPHNIMIDRTGRVLLTDFGIASSIQNLSDPSLGKDRYASPEQRQGGPLGPATDQYAFGRVMWECIGAGDSNLRTGSEPTAHALHQWFGRAIEEKPEDRFLNMAILHDNVQRLPCTQGITELAQWVKRVAAPKEQTHNFERTTRLSIRHARFTKRHAIYVSVVILCVVFIFIVGAIREAPRTMGPRFREDDVLKERFTNRPYTIDPRLRGDNKKKLSQHRYEESLKNKLNHDAPFP